MKKIFLFTTMLAAIIACNNPQQKADTAVAAIDSARVTTVLLKVNGMTCTGCEQTIRKAVKELPGVTEANASYTDSLATISYDPGISTVDEISKKIEDVGYKVLSDN